MNKALSAGLLAALAAVAGCSCCQDVPVSFEPLSNWLQYHGPECCHYPHSCPCCPYWDDQCQQWRAPNCPPSAARPAAPPTAQAVAPEPPPAPTPSNAREQVEAPDR